MKRMFPVLVSALALGIGVTVTVLCLLRSGDVSADNSTVIEEVTPLVSPQAGSVLTVCLPAVGDCPYTDVQAAVDAAATGDEIRVAAGTYTGVSVRQNMTQVVYLSKTVTIQGGYTVTDWTVPDPAANLTILDAQRQGRVFYVAGPISPTIAGLGVTGGYAPPGTWWYGAGMRIVSATATVRDNHFFSNTGYTGGALSLKFSAAVIEDNVIESNMAEYSGGIDIYQSPALIIRNTIQRNQAIDCFGGIGVLFGSPRIRDNLIRDNQALAGNGGGVHVSVSRNTTLERNTIVSNTAGGQMGGAYLGGVGPFTLTNNIIANNRTAQGCGGVHLESKRALLLHNTIAHNSGGNGVGLFIHLWHNPTAPPYIFDYASVSLTNTILVSHTIGISITGGNTLAINGILWDASTPITVSQSPTATVSVLAQYEGPPAFWDAFAGNFHILPHSAAVDRGVDTEIDTDIDWNARPLGSKPDLGADEVLAVFLPIVTRED